MDKINWNKLSGNPNAISILTRNIDKINWDKLSGNPNAIPILNRNIDKINWYELSQNPSAISILEKNLNKIDWEGVHFKKEVVWSKLCTNPNLFVYDYDSMKERCNIYKEELISRILHPDNFSKFIGWGLIY